MRLGGLQQLSTRQQRELTSIVRQVSVMQRMVVLQPIMLSSRWLHLERMGGVQQTSLMQQMVRTSVVQQTSMLQQMGRVKRMSVVLVISLCTFWCPLPVAATLRPLNRFPNLLQAPPHRGRTNSSSRSNLNLDGQAL